jgi:hypothetical protein
MIDVIERLVGGVQVVPRSSQTKEGTRQPEAPTKEEPKTKSSDDSDPDPSSDPFSG